jgi:hypothetical protein
VISNPAAGWCLHIDQIPLRKITPIIPSMTTPNIAPNTIPTSAPALRGARFVISRVDGNDVASERTGIAAVMVARNRRERRVVSFMLVFEFVFLFGGLKYKWYP